VRVKLGVVADMRFVRVKLGVVADMTETLERGRFPDEPSWHMLVSGLLAIEGEAGA
jgi:hypothetical protein